MDSIIKDQKSQRFVARVTAADKRLFQRAASIEGRSMAMFVIAHARDIARQVVSQSNRIHLDAEQSARFVEALLAPPRPLTPAMRESIRAYKKSVRSSVD